MREGRRAGPAGRHAPLFEYRGHWIDYDRGKDGKPVSRNLYAFRYDRDAGRTRRHSLRTEDLEAAKDKLLEQLAMSAPKSRDSYLAVVLESYFEQRTDAQKSGPSARRAGKVILESLGKLKRRIAPGDARVRDLSGAVQKEMIRIFAGEYGHSVKTISRNMSVLSAALAFGRIEAGHRILYNPLWIAEFLGVPDPAPRNWIPTDEELARFLDCLSSEAAFRWTVIALNTACRPEAGLDLAPAQRDRQFGLLDLNPPGRRQTKKHRPVIRETACLAAWLDRWEGEERRGRGKGGRKQGHPDGRYVPLASVDSLQSAYHRARARAGLKRMTPYAVRHKMKTVLQVAQVPDKQIQIWLGHRRPDSRTSDDYGQVRPEFLADAMAATDAFMRKLDARTKRDLFPSPAARKNTRKTPGTATVVPLRTPARR